MTKGEHLYQQAKNIIPGGTQLLSKRPEIFLPEGWPPYFERARGVEVTDLDNRTFVDMSLMGVGACLLGYADPEVDRAVQSAINRGVTSTLNAAEEVELAQELCALHSWAAMVRYARSGGEAMAVAVRIARCFSGRDKIAFCGYHGWSDWYLAANLSDGEALDGHLLPGLPPRGVPRNLRGTAIPFHYNRFDQFREVVDRHHRDLAAVVMEPQRGQPPSPGFLEEIRGVTRDLGAVLIFDEITTGFRMTTGGIHLLLGVEPDIAVFAKGISNGYAMAALIGRRAVMESAQRSFISSTNWTERIGPVAALATIRKHQREAVAQHLTSIGNQVKEGWQKAAEKAGLVIKTAGLASLPEFHLDDVSKDWRTHFTRFLLSRGYLAFHQFKPSYAHKQQHLEGYLREVEQAFEILASGREHPTEASAELGFYRLT
jgi:glutamate-1-semialdehyde aminotransferase